MLAKLIAQIVPSDAKYDRLFSPFAPNGAPAQLLEHLYHQYDGALADEPVPSQHLHYRALIAPMVDAAGGFARLDGPALKRIYAAYACCFERAETHHFQRAQWRDDRNFREALETTRGRVIEGMLAQETSESARRAYFGRWKECEATPVDIGGDTWLDLVQQMSPDDWHEIVQRWDWDWGVSVLNWITSQRLCDRATAVYVLGKGKPGEVSANEHAPHAGFVRALAARLEDGFYPVAELGLGELPLRTRLAFERELADARATLQSPWQLPIELVGFEGRRKAEPKYTISAGAVRYHYEYWLKHVAAPRPLTRY